MTAEHLTARAARLEQLFRGMCKEAALWKKADGLLEFGERRAYLTAIQDVIAGAEAARVVLLRARERMEEQELRLKRMQEDGR
jgi:hypothetical protein